MASDMLMCPCLCQPGLKKNPKLGHGEFSQIQASGTKVNECGHKMAQSQNRDQTTTQRGRDKEL